ncbi:hypothetical protein [Aliamphritea spongicola]|nr:hypothetical protein [Aliamphritea spongicola]
MNSGIEGEAEKCFSGLMPGYGQMVGIFSLQVVHQVVGMQRGCQLLYGWFPNGK